MSSPFAVPLAVLFALGGPGPAASLSLSGEEVVEAFRWQKEFLLLHREAPPDMRARLFKGFQQRILSSSASEVGDELFSVYEEAREGLRLSGLLEEARRREDALRTLVSDITRLHASVRKHLGQGSAEQVVALLRSNFDASAVRHGVLESALQELRDLGDGNAGPALEENARRELYAVLESWIATWNPRRAPAALRKDLRLLEGFLTAVPAGEATASGNPVSEAILDLAARLGRSAADASAGADERFGTLRNLNSSVDILRASKLHPGDEELDRVLRRDLVYTPRFVPREELKMVFLRPEARERPDVIDTESAVLKSVQILASEEETGDSSTTTRRLDAAVSPGDLRPFYLPPETALRLEYYLYPTRAGNGIGTSVSPRSVAVVLSNLKRLAPGQELKPPLPRMYLTDHSYVFDELRTMSFAYWVPQRAWSREELLDRLDEYVRRHPLPQDRRREVEGLSWLWDSSNLSDVSAGPLDTLAHGLPEDETGSRRAHKGEKLAELRDTFLLLVSPESSVKDLAALFSSNDGLLRRRAGEELPGAELARLLVRGGHLFGFERDGASALLDAALLFEGLPREGDLPGQKLAAGICPVIPMKPLESRK